MSRAHAPRRVRNIASYLWREGSNVKRRIESRVIGERGMGNRKASEGSVISEMRCVAAQPRQMEYSIYAISPDRIYYGLNARFYRLPRKGTCSLSVRVAYPDVEGSNERYTVYFPRLIDFNRTFRNGWRKSQPLYSKLRCYVLARSTTIRDSL